MRFVGFKAQDDRLVTINPSHVSAMSPDLQDPENCTRLIFPHGLEIVVNGRYEDVRIIVEDALCD